MFFASIRGSYLLAKRGASPLACTQQQVRQQPRRKSKGTTKGVERDVIKLSHKVASFSQGRQESHFHDHRLSQLTRKTGIGHNMNLGLAS